MKRKTVSLGIGIILVTIPICGFVFSEETGETKEEKIYFIQPKDTLWGIAGKIYANPFKWKKIHSANPGIKNPDLIYPGEKIVIPGEAITPIEKVVPGEMVAPEEKVAPVSETKVEELDRKSTEGAAQIPGEEGGSLPEEKAEISTETSEVSVPVEEKKEVPISRDRYLKKKFSPETLLVPVNWQYDGVITREEEKKILISAGDNIYLNIGSRKGLKAGMYCFVFRKGKKVYHSETGKLLGMNIERIGIVDIIETKENISSAKVVTSSEVLGVGDGIKIE